MADKESRNWKPKSDLELDDNQKLCPCWKVGDQMASKLNSSIQRRVDDNLLDLFQQNGRNEPKPMLLRSPSLQKKSHQNYYKNHLTCQLGWTWTWKHKKASWASELEQAGLMWGMWGWFDMSMPMKTACPALTETQNKPELGSVKMRNAATGEMARWLRALTLSVPSPHMEANNHLSTPVPGEYDVFFWSLLAGHPCDIQTERREML